MKLRNLLTEVSTPSKYEDFISQIDKATSSGDYRTFKSLLDAVSRKGKYDWIGMWYDSKDETGNVSKQVLKVLNF